MKQISIKSLFGNDFQLNSDRIDLVSIKYVLSIKFNIMIPTFLILL